MLHYLKMMMFQAMGRESSPPPRPISSIFRLVRCVTMVPLLLFFPSLTENSDRRLDNWFTIQSDNITDILN